MISGVRGSSEGGLNIWAMPGPEKISPMPAMLFVAGDWLSSICTAFVVSAEFVSQISEMSSSVGPIPSGFAGDSEKGRRSCRIVAGDVVIGSPGLVDMPKYRAESIGFWPCLAEMMINVDLIAPAILKRGDHFPDRIVGELDLV